MKTILDQHFHTYFSQPLQSLLVSSVDATRFGHVDHPQAFKIFKTLKTLVKVGGYVLNLGNHTNYTNFM